MPSPPNKTGGSGMTHRTARIGSLGQFDDSLELADIKAALPAYLNAIGHEARMTGNGTKLVARCPLHADKNPSFIAKWNGACWEWHCFPCGRGGTIIDLHAWRTGRNPRLEFPAVIEEVAELLNLPAVIGNGCPRQTAKAATPRVAEARPSIGLADLYHITTPWRSVLAESPALRAKVADSLGLRAETIACLVTPCFDALGIAPAGFEVPLKGGGTKALKAPCLAYIYEGAYKLRSPWGTNGPRFMMIGSPRRPWRSFWLQRKHPAITDVHVVESESSALAIIEAGYEAPFHGSCVVAVPGANGFKPEWATLFAGRSAHFWPDDDAPGEQFLNAVGMLIRPHAKTILRHRY